MLRTDMRQSALDYRFLAAVMGIYPLFLVCEGSLFENQTTHFVVFNQIVVRLGFGNMVSLPYWASQWHVPCARANM